MKEVEFTIIENKEVSPSTYMMTMRGDTSAITAPGQFINIKLDGHYLRRPMSICDYDEKGLMIIYRVVGEGTEDMSKMTTGDRFNALTGLGNGFDLSDIPEDAVLVGGGAGAMPMYALAKAMLAGSSSASHTTGGTDTSHTACASSTGAPTIIIGFTSAEDMFFLDEFRELGMQVVATTLDGSFGVKGTVVDGMKTIAEKLPYAVACGPDPMIKAVWENALDGQFDLSARMACGFGACMGCTIETASGPARVCKEGPIFKHNEIIW